MASVTGVDVVIAKSDSIKKLGEHLSVLLIIADDRQTPRDDNNQAASDARVKAS